MRRCSNCGYEGDSKFCPDCGTMMDEVIEITETGQEPNCVEFDLKENGENSGPFRTWKLVSGIISIIVSVIACIEATFIALGNAYDEIFNGCGLIAYAVSLFLLIFGIVSIVARKSKGKDGDTTIIVFATITAILGFYVETQYYLHFGAMGAWALVCAIFAFAARSKKL